jgi:[acyl-carrier-protein] S-malonyltransferase
MDAALAEVTLQRPKVPLIANVLAQPISDPWEIRRCLVDQVTGTVRWRESVLAMAGGGASLFVELGSGKVLSGLVKRVIEGVSAVSVGTPGDVAAFRTAMAAA